MNQIDVFKEAAKKSTHDEMNWKTVEVDGMPVNGESLYVCKFDKYPGWEYEICIVERSEFRMRESGYMLITNYYKLLEKK